MKPEVNRRQFLGRSLRGASIAAASYGRVLGANNKLMVANIGCGRRNLLKELIQVRPDTGIEIRAVCDTWKVRREKAAAEVKEFTGQDARQVVRYADVLAMPDIDAVVIATPDHLHARMLADAARAGKDVYVEKPIAMNMAELIEAVDAVKKHKRVVQVGTQMRSYPQTAAARRLVTGGGLGQILKVEQARNGYKPYWMGYGGAEFNSVKPRPEDIDWDAFLMGRKSRPFDPKQYVGWYGYRDFSGGPQTNLMVHFIDIVHYICGVTTPSKAVGLGGIYRWHDTYDVPDSVEIAFEYPEQFLVRYCTVFGNSGGKFAKWFGTRGTMDAQNLSPRRPWRVSGDGSGEPDRIENPSELPMEKRPHHMQNWLDCIRTREDPVAPIDAGYAHAVAVIMGDKALTSGRRQIYLPGSREVREG